MKQLGNLAIVCARRPELLMQVHAGRVTVFVGEGPQRWALCADWENDMEIDSIIRELNFGKYAMKKEAA